MEKLQYAFDSQVVFAKPLSVGILMSDKPLILMYSSKFCPFCFRAKALFQKKHVEFQELLIDGDPGLRQKMMKEAGQHTVPQIWIGSEHVGGCDDLFALDAKGELDTLLGAL